ncbi:MAG: hypothetical protein HFI86_02215 [Bacilli bacterium]|nr:hypothetical protein [Bacilli bacterium]
MPNMNSWMQEAEQQAKRYSDTLKQNNQYLIDQLTQSKQNTLNQLQQQQNNAIYNLNSNKATINQTATDNAKQLNVAKLMSLKSNQNAMNRAGLGTQGLIGSQVNEINNEYGNNLTSVLNQRTNDLRNLEKEKNNTLLTYDTNRLNLENEYGNNLANLQQSINDKALNQYNTVYSNYLNSKQQEYENQQAELARQEAIRQYNENLALQKAQLEYQKQQDAIANAQKWASINSSKSRLEFTNNENIQLSDNGKQLLDKCEKLRGMVTGNKMATRQLAINSIHSALKQAYNNGSINQNDVDYILNSFGLE